MRSLVTGGEAIVLDYIERGIFHIAGNGEIWRSAVLTRNLRAIPVQPRRVDRLRSDGYRSVRSTLRGKDYHAMAHRVIWISAHGPIGDGLEVNHRNGDRADNRLSNLEVVTPGQNLRHAYDNLNRFRAAGSANGMAKLTPEQVGQIKAKIARGYSKHSIARSYGISRTVIQRIADGRLWRDRGST